MPLYVASMTITEYLQATGEGESEFAMRAGVQPQTFRNIVKHGATPRLDTALKIHNASVKRPAGAQAEHITLYSMLPREPELEAS